ncbi:hypothetical protein TMCBR2_gp056 [Caulobacter phage TMCBR2]|uniref:Uncharacterized protein n=1 Tax=Caulobacter phage TMCBR2 TaxID=3025404 RepID=A0AAF0BYM8_9CAUD|nr:hypothetical protein TMCBR2_gp056 [Caulobacter phage TMCBR2]WDS38306.1 hypothetical protein TMCBR3_gp058 [Caulobacter phage TMCBR3]
MTPQERMSAHDQQQAREHAYDLAKVKAARPVKGGECRWCHKMARVRFPRITLCMDRALVEHVCGACAVIPPPVDEGRWYCETVSRERAIRVLETL